MYGEASHGRRRATARRSLNPPLSSANGVDGLPIAASLAARGGGAHLQPGDAKRTKFLENLVVCLLLIALTASLLLLTNMPGRPRPELVHVARDAVAPGGGGGGPKVVTRDEMRGAAAGERARERNLQQRPKEGGARPEDVPYHVSEERAGAAGGPAGATGFEPRLFVDYEKIDVVSAFNPRAFLWRGFLSPEESRYLREAAAREGMKDSKVVNSTSGERMASTVRTSSGAFLNHAKYGDDPVIANIERRMNIWSNLPHENGESLQILRYELSQEYKPHFDYFFDAEHKKNNRMATILVYLSTPEEGGETIFPGARRPREPRDPAPPPARRRGDSHLRALLRTTIRVPRPPRRAVRPRRRALLQGGAEEERGARGRDPVPGGEAGHRDRRAGGGRDRPEHRPRRLLALGLRGEQAPRARAGGRRAALLVAAGGRRARQGLEARELPGAQGREVERDQVVPRLRFQRPAAGQGARGVRRRGEREALVGGPRRAVHEEGARPGRGGGGRRL